MFCIVTGNIFNLHSLLLCVPYTFLGRYTQNYTIEVCIFCIYYVLFKHKILYTNEGKFKNR